MIIASSLLITVLATWLAAVAVTAVPVDIYAGSFTDIAGTPLAGYQVRHEETGAMHVTDRHGYLHLDLPVGLNVTFTILESVSFVEVQTATQTVPPSGLVGAFNEIVFQVPGKIMYDVLNLVLPHKRNFSQCQVVATVCNYKKSWSNCPQGYPGVVASLWPPQQQYTYYFGVWGKLSNETNPLPNKLTATSWDGGVFFMNIPMDRGQTDYEITAAYGRAPFTRTYVKCLKPGRLINAAPNQGPRALMPLGSFNRHDALPPVPPRELRKC